MTLPMAAIGPSGPAEPPVAIVAEEANHVLEEADVRRQYAPKCHGEEFYSPEDAADLDCALAASPGCDLYSPDQMMACGSSGLEILSVFPSNLTPFFRIW